MKKFILTLCAVLVAVASFAQIDATERHVNPQPMKLDMGRHSSPMMHMNRSSVAAVRKNIPISKTPRKAAAISSIDDLAGTYITAEYNLKSFDDKTGDFTLQNLGRRANVSTIEVTGENTISIIGLCHNNLYNAITATVDLENSKISIPEGQVLWNHSTYGDFVIKNAQGDGPITGTILEGGIIEIDQVWYETYVNEGTTAINFTYKTKIAPSNATFNGNTSLYVEQDPTTKAVTVWNFGSGDNWSGLAFEAVVDYSKMFRIPEQIVYHNDSYGDFNLYSTSNSYLVNLTGSMSEKKMTSTASVWVYKSGTGGWQILDTFGEIELIDESKFTFPEPVIGDLVTAPADLVATECPFTATRHIGVTSDNNYKGIVKIGFDGTDAYIQGIDCNLPEAWAKGTYDEETKNITIPMTYMGLHDGLTHYMATYSSAGPVDLVLAYNEADSTYTSADVSFYKMPTNGVIEWFENFKIKAYDIFPFKVAVEEGTEDAEKWTITPNLATEGQTISVQYNGTKRVKSVKAVKQGAAARTLAEATAEDIGKVVGADGKIYADVAAAQAASTTACAIIAYVGSETGEASPYNHGLAIAMKDASAGYLQWKTSKGSNDNPNQYTEPAPAIAAKEFGSALSSGRNNSTWPAFEAALANSIDVTDGISAAAPASGTSGWFLPSLYQWNMIVKGLSGQSADLSWGENDNYNASSLNTKIEAAGGIGLLSFGYWSSTEYDGDYAMSFNAGYGSVNTSTKSGYNNVRSAFAF